MERGKFITFEGPEGAGKSTQAAMLIAKLEAHGIEVIYTREPGGTKLGEAIRGILQYNAANEDPCPESEVLLFEASRAQLVRHVIDPALARGAWVLCDRFADSTTAYQGFGRGFPVDLMETINRFAIGSAVPDMTILLDVNVSLGMQRCAKRQVGQKIKYDRIESEALAFHEKVRQGYLELARRYPERFRKVDAMRLPEPIAEDIWKLVHDAFLAKK
ncbi:MAG TPA: dTMP kinase [Kiritimatiellia bacterium]|jgi:dTMP kinase|nr:MAG: Thymidylate kinase [Verrucomicrobia bacterium ADurb.Bin018]HOE36618.1 dTMP kinase [Kiritimatiellia bacterium]HOR74041.1 dTMP kinase [Kiritimatiellia bacterium]HOU58886.1 dTMP kinase [Kiritimatiellia bacterium]HPK69038.1 dTMP kinase [Kiritimatiellia bacterium]